MSQLLKNIKANTIVVDRFINEINAQDACFDHQIDIFYTVFKEVFRDFHIDTECQEALCKEVVDLYGKHLWVEGRDYEFGTKP